MRRDPRRARRQHDDETARAIRAHSPRLVCRAVASSVKRAPWLDSPGRDAVAGWSGDAARRRERRRGRNPRWPASPGTAASRTPLILPLRGTRVHPNHVTTAALLHRGRGRGAAMRRRRARAVDLGAALLDRRVDPRPRRRRARAAHRQGLGVRPPLRSRGGPHREAVAVRGHGRESARTARCSCWALAARRPRRRVAGRPSSCCAARWRGAEGLGAVRAADASAGSSSRTSCT